MLAAFDLWSLGKLSRVTLVAGLFAIAAHLLAIPIGQTHAWIAFADWALHLANAIQK